MNDNTYIYNFIVNNDDFEKLELDLHKFNPFNVLKIGHHEIRHSNVLSWLLDPNGHHNLNDTILKKVIAHIFIDPLNEERIPNNFDFQDIYLSGFSDAKVFREKEDIDILMISEARQFILLIENKIHAKESKHQLQTYLTKIRGTDRDKEYVILPVYLTLSGEEPRGAPYCVLDHSSICEIVANSITLHRDNMSIEVYNFIQFYLDSLRRILVMDESTKTLCREIYSKHKEAIDAIYSIGNEMDISSAMEDFVKDAGDQIEITKSGPKRISFMPADFENIPLMHINWGNGRPVSFCFEEYDGKIKLVLDVGPFEDPQKRIGFLQALKGKGIKIRPNAIQVNKKTTRICSETEKVKDWQDGDELAEKMAELYNKKTMRETKNKLLYVIEHFKWE